MKTTTRKLQEISGSLLVTLPSEWAQRYRLKKGSEVMITQNDDTTLKISKEFLYDEIKGESIIKYDSLLLRRFFREYLSSVDFVVVHFQECDTPKEEIRRFYDFIRDSMLNVEVIEETKEKMVLQIFRMNEVTIGSCIRRMFYLVKNMIDILTSKGDASQIIDLDKTVAKFYYMLVKQTRIFLQQGRYTKAEELTVIEAMDHRMVAEKIERIGDLVKELAITSDGKRFDKTLLDFFLFVVSRLDSAFSAFIKHDFDSALRIWDEQRSVFSRFSRLKEQYAKKKDMKSLELCSYLKNVYEHTRDIANIVR